MNRSGRYPLSFIERLRALRFHSAERGVVVYPRGSPPPPPAEIVHDHSVIVPSLRAGYVQIIEWSDDGRIERHDVKLM